MAEFKLKPRKINPRDVENFGEEAGVRPIVALTKKESASLKPKLKTKPSKSPVATKQNPYWAQFDAEASPTKGMNLRLNEHELEIIRYLAKTEDRSIQKTLRRIVIPAIHDALSKNKT